MSLSVRLTSLCVFLLTLFFSISTVNAEQKALLVGVGEYKLPGKDLPGIDVDLLLVQESLELIGFKDHQIRTLANRNATYKNIKEEFNSWLSNNTSSDDRIVFYFSGHGTRIFDNNGDEADRADEVLMSYDTKIVKDSKKRTTLKNVVVDDDLAQWIENLPSENVYIFIDACNSGTVTRSTVLSNKSLGIDEAKFKFFHYEGMPIIEEGTVEKSFLTRDLSTDNYVSLSATQDHEKALSTNVGSYFTLGINESIRNAVNTSTPLSMKDIQEDVQSFIKQRVSKNLVFHPNLGGNTSLGNEQFGLIKINNGYGPTWKRIDKLSTAGKYFTLTLNKKLYAIDDKINIKFNSPVDGYINVIAIDSIDQSVVLYPNQFNTNNQITKGDNNIPGLNEEFELLAADPTGPVLVAAFISPTPINLYQLTTQNRNNDGTIEAAFSSLSAVGTKAISNMARATQRDKFYSSSVVIKVN